MTDKIFYISDVRNLLGGEKSNFHLIELIKIDSSEVHKKHKLLETLSDAVEWFYEHKCVNECVSPSEWTEEAKRYFEKHILPLIEEHKKGEFEGHYWVPAHKYEIGQVLEKIPEECIHTNIFYETQNI